MPYRVHWASLVFAFDGVVILIFFAGRGCDTNCTLCFDYLLII